MSVRNRASAARSARLASSILGGLLAFAAPATPSATQLPISNRPLANDSYVPVSAPAIEALRLGDLECLRALTSNGAGAGAQLAWTRAFEAWHSALTGSQPGDAVPVGIQLADKDALVESYVREIAKRWPDRDHSFARRTEAVEYALLRRLSGLDSETVARWSARFEPLAAEQLRQIDGDARRTSERRAIALADVERLFPATRSGATAALQLLELELEAGRWRAARGWLQRAERHVALSSGQAGSEADLALQRRAQALEVLAARKPRRAATWAQSTRFVPDFNHGLVLPGFSKPRALARIEGQAGLAFLDGDRVVVQTTGFVFVLSPDDKDRIFEPWKLGFELGQPISRMVDRTGKDWPMFPIAEGESLYLVCGRADGKSSNFVQKIRTPRDLDLPISIWNLGGNGLYNGDGHLPLEDVLEAGMWEFQPGPLLIDDLLLVQARQWTWAERKGDREEDREVTTAGEARTWLLALDANTGRPRWKRFLGRGTDLVNDFGSRFGSRPLIRTPGAALQGTSSGVFIGTNLGAGFLVDLADGRLRSSFRNRRREPDEPGWKTGARPLSRVASEAGGELILWAAADSDELYPLSAELDFAPPTRPQPPRFVSYPPLAIDEGEWLLGGTARQVLILGRAGSRRTLSAHDLLTGRRYDSIYLSREEHWVPGALLSDEAVLSVSDGGLYLLDRQRELYLKAFQPLAMASDFAPGGLWARGKQLYLLAQGELYRFEIE